MAKPEPSLFEAMQVQAYACAALGSPMHGQILTALAENLRNGGVVHELTKDLDLRPGRDAVPLRIIGAVHREVLAGRAPQLARHYPSVGGAPGPELIDDYLATLETNRDAVVDGLGRTVQTNEVGRTTMLVTGMAYFARQFALDSVHLREVGSSSALNLMVDKFFFDTGTQTAGRPNSTVRFGPDAWEEPRVDIGGFPAITSRAGCDIAPLDAHDPQCRLTLLSFVWPDQDQRFARLRGALEIATTDPAYQMAAAADAGTWIDEQLSLLPDEPVVVFHSIVWQYFSQDTKDRFRDALRHHGERRNTPMAWLRMEPAGAAPDLQITTWANGVMVESDHVLATSSYHGIGTKRA